MQFAYRSKNDRTNNFQLIDGYCMIAWNYYYVDKCDRWPNHHHPLSWLCFGFSTYSTLNRCSTHPCVHDGDGLFLNVDEIHKNKWIRYEDVFRRIDDQNVKIIIIIVWAKRFGCWTVMSRHDVCIRNQLYQVHWTLIFNFVVSPRSHSIRFDSCWQFEFLSRFFSFSIRENEVCMLFTVSWLNV